MNNNIYFVAVTAKDGTSEDLSYPTWSLFEAIGWATQYYKICLSSAEKLTYTVCVGIGEYRGDLESAEAAFSEWKDNSTYGWGMLESGYLTLEVICNGEPATYKERFLLSNWDATVSCMEDWLFRDVLHDFPHGSELWLLRQYLIRHEEYIGTPFPF